MIFESLANGIRRYSKLIVVLWVVVLLVSVPFALKSSDVFETNLGKLAPQDSESVQGQDVINKYFSLSTIDTDVSGMQILVLEFDTEAGRTYAEEFHVTLNKALEASEEMSKKLQAFTFVNTYTNGESDKGMCLVAASYTLEFSSNNSVNDNTPELRSFVKNVQNGYAGGYSFNTYITGLPAISYDMANDAMNDLVKIDPFAVLLILLFIGLFFRSFITSATPPLTIGFAFVATLAAIFFIGQYLNIFFITEIMILVTMMGAGCDYCIFIIGRYKEERCSGKSSDDALHSAIVWAGESIAISGMSVVIGFGAMAICDYTMISTMGISLALGILIALLAALTLIPSVLYLIKDKVFWPTSLDYYKNEIRSKKGWHAKFGKAARRYFHRSAKFSLKHAEAITAIAIVITAPAAYVVLTDDYSYDMIAALSSGESGKGMEVMDEYSTLGTLLPSYVVLEYSDCIGNINMTTDEEGNTTGTIEWTKVGETTPALTIYEDMQILSKAITDSDDNISSVQGLFLFEEEYEYYSYFFEVTDVLVVYDYMVNFSSSLVSECLKAAEDTVKEKVQLARQRGFTEEQIMKQLAPTMDWVVNYNAGIVGGSFVNEEKTTAKITHIKMTVETCKSAMSNTSMDSLSGLKGYINSYVESTQEDDVKVTGSWIAGIGSMMYDIKNIISDQFIIIELVVVIMIFLLLLAVMRSWLIPLRLIFTILMSICWTMVLTHFVFVNLLGMEMVWALPMILMAICLGLGLDYDILLTTRIRENVMNGMSNDDAIYFALNHTGSLITICGLIMGSAFGVLMLSSMVMMKEIGFALCIAIFIDALIVRTYVVPAIMHLHGKYNWKGPGSKVPFPMNEVNTYDTIELSDLQTLDDKPKP